VTTDELRKIAEEIRKEAMRESEKLDSQQVLNFLKFYATRPK
jgi:hypothetical protein